MSLAEMLERMEQNESKAPEITIEEAFELYQNKPVFKVGDKVVQVKGVEFYKSSQGQNYSIVTKIYDTPVRVKDEEGSPVHYYDMEVLSFNKAFATFDVESWRFKKYESPETVSE